MRQLLPPRRLPAHQGRVLFEAVTGHVGGDTNAACFYLLDEHPAGWLVLLPTDPDDLRNQATATATATTRPAPLDDHTASQAGVDYGYVIGPDRLQVRPACAAAGSRSPTRPGPLVGGLWHYAAAALKQYKLAMVTTRSGHDNRTIVLRQQGDRRTVSAAGPHWTTS